MRKIVHFVVGAARRITTSGHPLAVSVQTETRAPMDRWRAAASAAVADASASASTSRPPLDVSAFDRSNLTVYLKDVVTLVLENRPEDPVAFVADYLRRVLSGASPLSRAYQYLTLSPHHRQAFVDNATVAFSVLDAGPRGLTGADHADLLRTLLADAPPDVARAAADALAPRPDASVDFFEFLASARACLALRELLVELDDAFRTASPAEAADREPAAVPPASNRRLPRDVLRRLLVADGEHASPGSISRAAAMEAIETLPEEGGTRDEVATALVRAVRATPA